MIRAPFGYRVIFQNSVREMKWRSVGHELFSVGRKEQG